MCPHSLSRPRCLWGDRITFFISLVIINIIIDHTFVASIIIYLSFSTYKDNASRGKHSLQAIIICNFEKKISQFDLEVCRAFHLEKLITFLGKLSNWLRSVDANSLISMSMICGGSMACSTRMWQTCGLSSALLPCGIQMEGPASDPCCSRLTKCAST
jgi:hypothetical protein